MFISTSVSDLEISSKPGVSAKYKVYGLLSDARTSTRDNVTSVVSNLGC